MPTRRNFLAAGLAAAAISGTGSAHAADALKLDLSDYEKIPAAKFPWGWIRWVMNAEIDPESELTVGLVLIEPHQTNPLHIHPNSSEVLHLLSGTFEHRIGERWIPMKAGDTLRIPKDIPHQARTGESRCLSLIVYNTGKRVMVPVEEKGK